MTRACAYRYAVQPANACMAGRPRTGSASGRPNTSRPGNEASQIRAVPCPMRTC